uniref:Phosphopantothenoylcysteine decarboxylase n=1 Tax=Coturnix japonica TaxID=93934 RepID=A0A8C2T4K6_COTJA
MLLPCGLCWRRLEVKVSSVAAVSDSIRLSDLAWCENNEVYIVVTNVMLLNCLLFTVLCCEGLVICILSHLQLWKGRSDPVLHIELRRWADLMVVAPLDANTLAKLANGICDNLLTCVIRAWDLHKPLLFCPAMNTAMWEHPITAQQVEQLKGFGYTEIPCVVKKLVCGDEGLAFLASEFLGRCNAFRECFSGDDDLEIFTV